MLSWAMDNQCTGCFIGQHFSRWEEIDGLSYGKANVSIKGHNGKSQQDYFFIIGFALGGGQIGNENSHNFPDDESICSQK